MSRNAHIQDGYTLERVDVHDSGGEAAAAATPPVVLVRGAECYVGRNDNPSFGACVQSFFIERAT